jgi:broad specificity phosphatase PhoE
MTTTLILVRHGETIWHRDNRYAGTSEVPLTERGRQQAARLARFADEAGLNAIYSSTLSRTIETATPSSTATDLDLVTDARLCEVDFGDGEGMTRAEMAEAFPAELEAYLAAPARHPLPGGEAGIDAIARAQPAVEDIVERHDGGRVLVVMHSTLLRLLIADAIGLNPDDYRRTFPSVDNCALNTLRYVAGEAALLGYNVPV